MLLPNAQQYYTYLKKQHLGATKRIHFWTPTRNDETGIYGDLGRDSKGVPERRISIIFRAENHRNVKLVEVSRIFKLNHARKSSNQHRLIVLSLDRAYLDS